MRIAFISYEYAGGPSSGGIGTYVRNAASMLAARGHDVEVFTSGSVNWSAVVNPGIRLHTVLIGPRSGFSRAVVGVFAARHEERPFDVIEGPEYHADAAEIAARFPDIPLVVKLHAPSFTIKASNDSYVGWRARWRYYLGGLRRGRWPDNPWRYSPERDEERTHTLSADEVVANSRATADRVGTAWCLPKEKLSVTPYVYTPPEGAVDSDPRCGTNCVLFLGRLEVRKGVIELAKAIPLVRRRAANVRFRFVGRDLLHPADGAPLSRHIERIAGRHAEAIQFVGGVPYDSVSRELRNADVCVFPSDWEASGYVCLEAMAAARSVIGSSAGGMAEIIDHGRTGLLVSPRDPKGIASAIVTLLHDPERRIAMARAARESVVTAYSADVIAPLQEASYVRAIENARTRCSAKVLYRVLPDPI